MFIDYFKIMMNNSKMECLPSKFESSNINK